MSAHQNQPEDLPTGNTEGHADPIGPITMPKRSLIGGRAFALVGFASVIAVGITEYCDPSTGPTVSFD